KELRVEKILGPDRVGRVRLQLQRLAPSGLGLRESVGVEEREPELELRERAPRMLLRDGRDPVEGPRPIGDRGAELPVERVVAGEDLRGVLLLALPEEREGLAE